MLLTVETGSGKEVLDSLKEISEVKDAYQLFGVYDLMIHVEAETRQELKDLIDNRIRGIGKIRSTMPLICLKEDGVQFGI